MGSVFISHNWADKPIAKRIAETLRLFGVDVWLDEAEIKLGDSLIEKIRAGIDSVDYVVALLSENSIESEWVKKEIDIAMNQEIEGKSVKVLPILVQKCQLPGFLKGKLYADMSNSKNFKSALPLLLSRVGVRRDLIEKHDSVDNDKLIKDKIAKRLEIEDAIRAGNIGHIYNIMRDMESYRDSETISEPFVLHSLVGFVDGEYPIHLKLEALRLIGFLNDPNFVHYIEHHIYDSNLVVAIKALQTITDLGASSSFQKIFDLFVSADSNALQETCLGYFQKVKVADDAMVLSLLKAMEAWRAERSDDPGANLKFVRVLSAQRGWRRHRVFKLLVGCLESQIEEVRAATLDAILEAATQEELWFPHQEIAEDLKSKLQQLMQSGSRLEKTQCWLICLLWPEFDRGELWDDILTSELESVAALFWELEVQGFRLEYTLNETIDFISMEKLIERADSDLKDTLFHALLESSNLEALKIVARNNYNVPDSRIGNVLKALVNSEPGSSELIPLVDFATSRRRETAWHETLRLIVMHMNGKIELEELLKEFPRKGISDHFEAHEYPVRNYLEQIRDSAKGNARKRIGALLRSVEKEFG